MAKKNQQVETPAPAVGATMTAQEVADDLGVDVKSFRAWMRRERGETIGRGNRYAFRSEDLDKIRAAYGERGSKQVVIEFGDEDVDEVAQ